MPRFRPETAWTGRWGPSSLSLALAYRVRSFRSTSYLFRTARLITAPISPAPPLKSVTFSSGHWPSSAVSFCSRRTIPQLARQCTQRPGLAPKGPRRYVYGLTAQKSGLSGRVGGQGGARSPSSILQANLYADALAEFRSLAYSYACLRALPRTARVRSPFLLCLLTARSVQVRTGRCRAGHS